MLRRLFAALLFVGVALGVSSGANAQYMKITTDNPTDNTRLRASGTTILTITLDTTHDKNGSLQSCNSHTAANGCGSGTTAQALDMFGYTLALKATGGTVAWGTFTPNDATYTDTQAPQISTTEIEINQFKSTGVTAPGLITIGTLPVTPTGGTNPGVGLQVGPGALNPFGFGTGFATDCDGFFFPNFYVVGDPLDPCGAVSGSAGDWFDWDGARPGQGTGNNAPNISAPANASGAEGTALSPITATATDGDAADVLAITLTGTPPGFVSFSSSPGPSPNTATVTGTPGFSDAGAYSINWHVSDGTDAANTSTALTIANTNRAPTLAQPTNMFVSEGSTAEQVLTGSDPDNDALTFGIAAGPAFMSLVSPDATHSTVRLVPNFTQSGTYNATVGVSDGVATPDQKSFMITVSNTNRPPNFGPLAPMTVDEGATADQGVAATDPDGDNLIFSLVSGPTYVTVTNVTTTTGNIHLAPGFSDAGTASATVQAADPSNASHVSGLFITVNDVAHNQNPVLSQPTNMTVDEGATQDQALAATDPDGDALTFSLSSGPTYATVTTTTPGTGTAAGNLHLAPGFSDAGTASVSVSVTDGSANDSKSLLVTVNNVNRPPTFPPIAPMTVDEGATADQGLAAFDPDGDNLTFSLVSGPTYVTVTTVTTTTGNIHLAPGFSDAGTASATIQAADPSNASHVSGLFITVNDVVVGHAPVLAAVSNMTVAEGATDDQPLSALDADNDPLSFSLVSGPTYATVTTIDPGTGTGAGNLHLAPGFSDSGTAGATVRASDGTLSDSKSLTITVTNVNHPPTLTQPSNMTVNEGATADQVLNASDPDGDALTFTKISGPTFLTIVPVNATTAVAHLMPGFNDAGNTGATIDVSDGPLHDGKSFSILVLNVDRGPVLVAIPDQTVAEGSTGGVAVHASDPDGDDVDLSLGAHPAFVSLDPDFPGPFVDGTVLLAPPFGSVGTYSVTVVAHSNLLTDSKTFTLTVTDVNRPPVLDEPDDMVVDEGTTRDQALTASDPDGDHLTFTKVSGPLYLTVTTVTSTSGNAHVAPGFSDAGGGIAVVRASDGSLSDTQSFSISVRNVNRAPVSNPGGPYTGTVGVPIAFDGSGSSDPDGDVLSYEWDFGDAANGTGVNPMHSYAAAGVFTVQLTVDDGHASASANTIATIANELEASAFAQTTGDVKPKSGKPRYCFQIQPVDADYANSDVLRNTIVMKYNGVTVPAEAERSSAASDLNGDGIQEIQACFTRASMRTLFAGLGAGGHSVEVAIEGDLSSGAKFHATLIIIVRGPVSGSALEASVSPNPLNPATTLVYITTKPGVVRIGMYDPQGRLVRTIQEGTYTVAGQHEVMVDGRGDHGEKLASGVYFIRGETAEGTFKNTITILK